jgi:hypothetical protein
VEGPDRVWEGAKITFLSNPEIVTTIEIIDCFFKLFFAESLDACGELAGMALEERIEDYWRMLKQGTLRLHDPEIDDEPFIIQLTETPSQQARARPTGAKLFAVRQHLHRAARRFQSGSATQAAAGGAGRRDW